jgi:alcohol dehydrogenase class IV
MESARQCGCDCILAIGGGSALDVGKTAALAPLNRSVRDFLSGAVRATDPRVLPILAVPTTAGTGSEATVSVVFTDPEALKKASFRGDSLLPKTVILDRELLKTCPTSVLAHSGLDALVQSIESYVSRGANRLTDALALEAAILIGQSLPAALRDPDDSRVGEALLLGSYLAGVALNTSRLGLVHGLAHPLGARTGAAHGLLCGLLMPHVLRFNRGYDLEKSHDLAVALCAPGEDLAGFLADLLERCECPTRLSSLGVSESDLPIVAAEALPSGSTQANPRPVSEEDALRVLRAAF